MTASFTFTPQPRAFTLLCLALVLTLFASANQAAAQQQQPSFYYDVVFTAGETVHTGKFTKQGNTGTLVVSYFSQETQRTEQVRMQMTYKNSVSGYIWKSGPAIDVRTGARHASYAPDNLIFRQYPDGSEKMFVVDDAGVEALAIVTGSGTIAAPRPQVQRQLASYWLDR